MDDTKHFRVITTPSDLNAFSIFEQMRQIFTNSNLMKDVKNTLFLTHENVNVDAINKFVNSFLFGTDDLRDIRVGANIIFKQNVSIKKHVMIGGERVETSQYIANGEMTTLTGIFDVYKEILPNGKVNKKRVEVFSLKEKYPKDPDCKRIITTESGKTIVIIRKYKQDKQTYRINNIKLAYGSTINSIQGGERKNIIIFATKWFTWRLLYTAVTRAKENVWIIGSKSDIHTAVTREDLPRTVTLGEHIKVYFNQMKIAIDKILDQTKMLTFFSFSNALTCKIKVSKNLENVFYKFNKFNPIYYYSIYKDRFDEEIIKTLFKLTLKFNRKNIKNKKLTTSGSDEEEEEEEKVTEEKEKKKSKQHHHHKSKKLNKLKNSDSDEMSE